MPDRPRGLRAKLLAAVVGAVAVAVACLTVAFNVVLHHRLDADVDAVLMGRATADLEAIDLRGGHLRAAEAPDQAVSGSQRWIYAGTRVLEHPQRISLAIDRAAAALAGGSSRRVDLRASDTRLLAVPVEQGGRRLGTVVEGTSTAQAEETERIALIASLILAAALMVLVLVAARWILAAALTPVSRMTAAAAAWSEHDVDRRFGLGEPRDEISQLAATLDGLLNRLSASLRREQRFTAELSHELRTPLARIISETQLALRDGRTAAERGAALETIGRSAAQLQRTLDALLAAARAQTPGRRAAADAGRALATAIEASSTLVDRRGITVGVVEPPVPVRVDVEADLVERVLSPVLENAGRHARTAVTVTIAQAGRDVIYVITDDGPGVDAAEVQTIFEPGRRGRAAAVGVPSPGESGAGLGLTLARRLARMAGGDIEATADPGGGRFTVRLPGA